MTDINIHDQADKLRNLARKSAVDSSFDTPSPWMIVVGGGKEGIGTSTLAVNLAVEAMRQEQRVVLVDAHPTRGDVAKLCHVDLPWTLSDVLTGQCSMDEAIAPGPRGLQILSGVQKKPLSEDLTEFTYRRFLNQLNQLNDQADLIIVDIGEAADDAATYHWCAADLVCLVTTPETSSVMGTYAVIKRQLTENRSANVRLIINHTDDKTAADVFRRISRSCQRFLGLSLLQGGALPTDPDFHRVMDAGPPWTDQTPKYPALRAIQQIVTAMIADQKSRMVTTKMVSGT